MFHSILFPTYNVSIPDEPDNEDPEDPGGGSGGGGEDEGPTTLNPTFTGSRKNMNLWETVLAAFPNAETYSIFNVTFDATSKIGASSPSQYALVTGSFPAGSTLTITNEGAILGAGGKGGDYGLVVGFDGEDGGTAVLFSSDATLVNNGLIAGGGGGGAGGNNTYTIVTGLPAYLGGTTGYAVGGGGAGFDGGESGLTPEDTRYIEQKGKEDRGGAARSATSGAGGGLAAAGANGTAGGTGGGAGDAIHKAGYTVTTSGTGTTTGTVSATT